MLHYAYFMLAPNYRSIMRAMCEHYASQVPCCVGGPQRPPTTRKSKIRPDAGEDTTNAPAGAPHRQAALALPYANELVVISSEKRY